MGFCHSRAFGHQVAFGQHPVMQRFDYRSSLFLAYSPSIFIAHVSGLPFNSVQDANRVQDLLGQPAFVGHVQIEKLAASMRRAADLSDALFSKAAL